MSLIEPTVTVVAVTPGLAAGAAPAGVPTDRARPAIIETAPKPATKLRTTYRRREVTGPLFSPGDLPGASVTHVHLHGFPIECDSAACSRRTLQPSRRRSIRSRPGRRGDDRRRPSVGL